MSLVKAQCTNCGGTLDVDNNSEAAVCPFCGQAYIVEKAIQQFQITNNTHIENIYIDGEYEKLHDAAEYFISNGEYHKAIEKYEIIKRDYPQKDVQDALNYIIALTYNYDVQRYISEIRNRNSNDVSEIDIIGMAIRHYEDGIQWVPAEKRPQEYDLFRGKLLAARTSEQNRIDNNNKQAKQKRLTVAIVFGVIAVLGLIFALVGNKILKSAGWLMVILGIYLAISIPSYLKKKDNNPSVKYKPSKFLISLLLIYPFIIGMILDYGELIFFGIFSGMVGVAMFILTIKDFSRNHPL